MNNKNVFNNRKILFRDYPSKEMRGALKVLNDSLKKTSATLLPRVQLKQAIDIVREEWFKVIILLIYLSLMTCKY